MPDPHLRVADTDREAVLPGRLGLPDVWPVWVIGPWGAALLAQSVAAL